MAMSPKERQLARQLTLADQDLAAAEMRMPATRGDIAALRAVMVEIRDILLATAAEDKAARRRSAA